MYSGEGGMILDSFFISYFIISTSCDNPFHSADIRWLTHQKCSWHWVSVLQFTHRMMKLPGRPLFRRMNSRLWRDPAIPAYYDCHVHCQRYFAVKGVGHPRRIFVWRPIKLNQYSFCTRTDVFFTFSGCLLVKEKNNCQVSACLFENSY